MVRGKNKMKNIIFLIAVKNKDFEKSWPKMQALAKLAGMGISKKMQAKGKTYLWKLRK